LYALFSVGGLYHLVTGGNSVAVLWFALSGCARSNGVLNAGYFCFQTLHRAYDAVFIEKRAYVSESLFSCLQSRLLFVSMQSILFQSNKFSCSTVLVLKYAYG
jgi:phosphatidylinositol glycan class V